MKQIASSSWEYMTSKMKERRGNDLTMTNKLRIEMLNERDPRLYDWEDIVDNDPANGNKELADRLDQNRRDAEQKVTSVS